MKASDHGIIEAAAQVKQAMSQKKAAAATVPTKPASPVAKIVTAGVWVAAAGTLAAVLIAN